MSRSLGRTLNDELRVRLSGEDLSRWANKVILIVTVDEHGCPHPAMLSYFELVMKDPHNIRMAMFKNSNTTEYIRRNGKATISIIDERLAYYIKGNARELRREMRCAPHNSKLNLEIEAVLADAANEELEPGAYVSSGVTYRSLNLNEQLLKAKEILAELLLDEHYEG